MIVKFIKYWEQIPYLYCFAIILDPRYQLYLFYDTCEILSEILPVNYIDTVYTDAAQKFYDFFTA